MAEPAAGGGSGTPSAPAPPAAGSQEDERSSGGARREAEGAAADADTGDQKADLQQILKTPDVTARSKKNAGFSATLRKRSHKSPSVRKSPLGLSLKRLSPWKSSPGQDQSLTSFNLSPRQIISPQAKRRSWCRSSLKGTKRRKSLPPVHQDVTELSKSISLDLPETERLAQLLLSSFQFAAQKLEHILKDSDGFSPEAFKANVASVSADLKRHVQKLSRDGTLRRCVDDPSGTPPDKALDDLVAQIKEYIARFTAECQAWDQLLLRHRESAEEMSRQLEECRRSGGRAEPCDYLQTSQAEVLGSKPNYQQVLEEQGQVLSCVELVLDELQQAVKLLQALGEESQQTLRRLSEQLARRTFRQLENSPVRKLMAKPPPPEG